MIEIKTNNRLFSMYLKDYPYMPAGAKICMTHHLKQQRKSGSLMATQCYIKPAKCCILHMFSQTD